MSQGAANPGMPSPMTGSPWEQNMMARMGRGNPEDAALQQRMMAAQAQMGQGPQFQGSGRPEWQSVGPESGLNRLAPGTGGPLGGEQIARVGNAMGGPPAIRPGPGAGQSNQAAMATGYSAYKPGAMGQFARANPATTKPAENTQWMQRK